MSKDEYTRLFVYMEKRFNKIEAELAKKAEAEQMYAGFDGLVKRIENVEHELAMHGHQLTRHEQWLQEIAKNTSMQLSPP